MICPFGNIKCHTQGCQSVPQCSQEVLDGDDEDFEKPCPTCGDINGMRNPCCPDYDPLHIDNCGYG